MRFQLLLLALTLCAFSAKAEKLLKPSSSLQVLYNSNINFGFNFFKTLSSTYNGENFICSPLSAFTALSMLYHGAAGNTSELMRQTLGLPKNNHLVDQGFKDLFNDFNNVKYVTLDLANKIFIKEGFNAKAKFLKLTQDVFQSVAKEIDMSKPSDAAKTINDWVSEQTHEKIQNLIDPDSINEDSILFLVSALYFKGQWAYEFKEHSETKFFVNKDTLIDTPFMQVKSNIRYAHSDHLQAQVVRVPYKNWNLEMVIIVPDEIDGLSELEKRLNSVDYHQLIENAYGYDVTLIMPKFKFESTLDLEDSLTQLGLGDLFDKPNLSGISDANLKVTKVTQKTFVEVNEVGTEAAAATAIGVSYYSAGAVYPSVELRVDRPFLFTIRKSSTVLFQGHVYDPRQ